MPPLAAILGNTQRFKMTDIQKEYYFSKIAIILGSILLFIITALFVFVIYIFYKADFRIPTIIFFCTFLLFLTTLPKFYQRVNFFLTDTPALILTKDELIDNINLQRFNWGDIKSVSAASIKMKTRVNYIAISFIDADKYINKIKSPYKRYIAKLNGKYFKGTFSIQPNIIKCDNAELLSSLTKYHREIK